MYSFQDLAECYLTALFEDANMIAPHAKRSTILPSDIRLLELSPLPVLTPSISPELDWGKEAPDEPNPTFSQVIQPQKNVRISTPKQQIPAAVHFKEKAKELEPNSRTVNSSSEEIAKTKQLQMPKGWSFV
uniref:Histone H2A/H2B/H3 domain-containing protein n=1 Tax=Ditylenchus dipsaci TaxID=166011 RepID=A0A915EMX6_9BILA